MAQTNNCQFACRTSCGRMSEESAVLDIDSLIKSVSKLTLMQETAKQKKNHKKEMNVKYKEITMLERIDEEAVLF